MLINIIMSLFFGAGIDSLFYYLYLTKIKEIKSKNKRLFIYILTIYILLNMIIRYNLYLYLTFDVCIYLYLKIVYKSNITDMFLIIFLEFYLMLNCLVCYFLINNYIISCIISRTIIFVPLLFKNKLIINYKKYLKLWNRNRIKKMPVKSLTLRNISLTIMNILIIIGYFSLIYLQNKLK